MVSSPDALLRSDIQGFVQKGTPTILDTGSVEEAISVFKSNSARAVYVLKADGSLAGVITSTDLTKLNQEKKPATALQLATSDKVIGIRQDAELWQLLKIMNGDNAARRSFEQLPVLDADNKPVGTVTKEALRVSLGDIEIPVSGASAAGLSGLSLK